jgi:hypothetical protein
MLYSSPLIPPEDVRLTELQERWHLWAGSSQAWLFLVVIFGSHLDDQGKTIETELEKRNLLRYAGENYFIVIKLDFLIWILTDKQLAELCLSVVVGGKGTFTRQNSTPTRPRMQMQQTVVFIK